MKLNSTDPGGGCASQAGPACLAEELGRGHPHEHRLVPGTTLRDRCSEVNRVITTLLSQHLFILFNPLKHGTLAFFFFYTNQQE